MKKNPQIIAVNFAVESFGLFIYDRFRAEIHKKGKSILVIKTYKI